MDRKLQSEQKSKLIDMKGIERDYTCGSNIIHALREIDLSIYRGEFIGIMGPSGSGKSTLLNLIGCLDSPTKGQYQLKGNNINELSRKEKASIRNKVLGFVFQSFNLISELDIASNVALPLKYSKIPKREWKQMVEESLETVGLEGMGYRYPDQLSGGQQQRVAIARAFVNKPDIILADEPTGNLDSATGQDIMEELRRLKEQSNRTVIVITHDSRIAGYADRLIRIEDGKLIEDMYMVNKVTTKSNLSNPFIELNEEAEDEKIL